MDRGRKRSALFTAATMTIAAAKLGLMDSAAATLINFFDHGFSGDASFNRGDLNTG
jgi:hypothetical protein